MAQEKYILVSLYCEQSHIENTFVQNLYEYGLVNLEERESETFIDEDDITEIERLFRLHHDLGINYEGLDAIKQMLNRMRKMEKELDLLQKKLRLYE
ncbi:chaperone modulator CbpM [Aequorivita capsosiphonis]|uniref:chaperone modulator CbpM n=1 Tax=Aequorivita capsosiphonis TaxID=487317 RepID=UPI0003F69E02|nr:chaperone modulator CbpM [Aequorivita capsosiphonis]